MKSLQESLLDSEEQIAKDLDKSALMIYPMNSFELYWFGTMGDSLVSKVITECVDGDAVINSRYLDKKLYNEIREHNNNISSTFKSFRKNFDTSFERNEGLGYICAYLMSYPLLSDSGKLINPAATRGFNLGLNKFIDKRIKLTHKDLRIMPDGCLRYSFVLETDDEEFRDMYSVDKMNIAIALKPIDTVL